MMFLLHHSALVTGAFFLYFYCIFVSFFFVLLDPSHIFDKTLLAFMLFCS